jgi:hypothetical protein
MASRQALVLSGDCATHDWSVDRVTERDMQVGAEPTLWRTDVVSSSREMSRDDGLLLCQGMNRVGELNLTVNPMGCLLQPLKDFRTKDVAADNGEI